MRLLSTRDDRKTSLCVGTKIKSFILTQHLQAEHHEEAEEDREVLSESGVMFLQDLEEHHEQQSSRC